MAQGMQIRSVNVVSVSILMFVEVAEKLVKHSAIGSPHKTHWPLIREHVLCHAHTRAARTFYLHRKQCAQQNLMGFETCLAAFFQIDFFLKNQHMQCWKPESKHYEL